MESTDIYIGPEPHIEVHKYYAGIVPLAVVLSLVLQVFLPIHIRWASYLELPLLVTLYFALSKRNPSSGLLLGMTIGLLQDSLTPSTPLGLYGIAKTLVGYGGSTIGSRLDVEHPLARVMLTIGFYLFHHVVFAFTSYRLMNRHEPYFTVPLLIASGVNAGIAVVLFPFLDRFRRLS
jgi:rod shape-determining protein MreD